MIILEVRDLRTYFYTHNGAVKAVDGVSFCLEGGEILGLVGESGCGKTITCLSILRLLPTPNAKIVGGEIYFNGEDLLMKTEKQMRRIRGRMISMILQDPMTSLNPVFTIGNQIAEAIRIHQKVGKSIAWEKVKEMLKLVGIFPPEKRMRNFPHQLSGGMRQRAAGGIALSCHPKLIIADEPTTALDVTIQAQYLQLIEDIKRKFDISVIFVTHDFGIVARICTKVVVMYAGKIVETAPVEEIFNNPIHPYTVALMNSVPDVNKEEVKRLYSIDGQPPSLISLPPGCRFATRCVMAKDKCLETYPPETFVNSGHSVSCWMVSHG